MSLKGTSLQTTSVLFLKIVIQGATLLTLTRLLPPGDFGLLVGIASLAMMIGTLSPYGTNLLIIKSISDTEDQQREILEKSLGTTLGLSSLLFLAYILIAPQILPGSDTYLIPIILIGASEIVLQPFITLCSSYQIKQNEAARSQITMLSPMALRLIFAIALYILDSKSALLHYSIFYPILSIACIIFSAHKLTPHWPSVKSWRILSASEIKKSFSYAVVEVSNKAGSEIDKILSVQLLPLNHAGAYSTAARIIGAINTPIIGMVLAHLPGLFKASNDPSKRKNMHKKLFFITMFYGISLAIVTYLAAPLITRFFSSQYSQIETFIEIMSLSIPALTLRLTGSNILVSISGANYRAILETTGIGVLILCSLLLSKSTPMALPYSVIISEAFISIATWVYIFMANTPNRPSSAKRT